jgi:hypothetical protein
VLPRCAGHGDGSEASEEDEESSASSATSSSGDSISGLNPGTVLRSAGGSSASQAGGDPAAQVDASSVEIPSRADTPGGAPTHRTLRADVMSVTTSMLTRRRRGAVDSSAGRCSTTGVHEASASVRPTTRRGDFLTAHGFIIRHAVTAAVRHVTEPVSRVVAWLVLARCTSPRRHPCRQPLIADAIRFLARYEMNRRLVLRLCVVHAATRFGVLYSLYTTQSVGGTIASVVLQMVIGARITMLMHVLGVNHLEPLGAITTVWGAYVTFVGLHIWKLNGGSKMPGPSAMPVCCGSSA